jgi:exosortase D (VPLPA-CTERM-specific)
MSEVTAKASIHSSAAISAAVAASCAFLFFGVWTKLGRDWWSDENYSHGLLVPFIIGFVVWELRDRIFATAKPSRTLGIIAAIFSVLMLTTGTLGAELYTQRMAFVAMLAAIAIYFGGMGVLKLLSVPFVLLLLSIPIPQILFNRIAFPLQILASQMSVWMIRMFEVPVVRKGNVLDILPSGATQTIPLEVVEACSGIRSMMTLVTLAVVLVYFTSRRGKGTFGMSSGDLLRAAILAFSAIPIAVITNAVRVGITGILTHYYGQQATNDTWHDVSGWLVYLVALAILLATNEVLRRLIKARGKDAGTTSELSAGGNGFRSALPLVVIIATSGLLVNWFATRSEVIPERRPLTEISDKLGDWSQRGAEIKFAPEVEGMLRTADYTMREYMLPDGRVSNIYIGYYDTQRTGATYHSPQNCLPGAGWVLSEPERIELVRSDGQRFEANRYIIENGVYREVMIYWYQGRGRIEASEYRDKLNTVIDSVMRNRTDGAMIRVMTAAGRNNDEDAFKAASDLAVKLADELPAFIPK